MSMASRRILRRVVVGVTDGVPAFSCAVTCTIACTAGAWCQVVPPPEAENAATHYARAHAMAAVDGGLLTEDEWIVLSDLASGRAPMRGSSQWVDRARAVLAKAQPILDAAAQGAAIPECDWGLDRSQGFALGLPHLSPQRSLARLLSAKSAIALADGDVDGVIQSAKMQLALSQHSAQDGVIVSSLVGAAVASMTASRAQDLLATGIVNQEDAAMIASMLKGAAEGDAFNLGGAMHGEGEMLAASMGTAEQRQAMAKSEGFEMLDDVDEEQAQAQLSQLKGWYDGLGDALAMDDRTAGRAAYLAILAEVEASGNTFAQAIMPAMDMLLESHDRCVEQLLAAAAQYEAIATGQVPASAHANAAYWYTRAAQGAMAIPPEVQTSAMLARVAPEAVSGEQLAKLKEINERMDRIVGSPLREAAAIERCAFTIPGGNELDLLLMGAMRGALRFELVDAIHRSPADAEAAVIAMLRAVRHLASDPSVAHAITASLLLQDVEWAMESTTFDAEAIVRLHDVAAQLDAGDPCGFSRAAAGEVEALFGFAMPRRADPDMRVSRLARASELSLEQLFFFRCVWWWSPEELQPGEDLIRWDEIVPADRLLEAKAKADCLQSSCFMASTVEEMRTGPLLGSCESPTVVDTAAAASLADATWARVQRALAPAVAPAPAPARAISE